jgi:hypothetical protein
LECRAFGHHHGHINNAHEHGKLEEGHTFRSVKIPHPATVVGLQGSVPTLDLPAAMQPYFTPKGTPANPLLFFLEKERAMSPTIAQGAESTTPVSAGQTWYVRPV